ncbi:MAG: hypothetical protein GX863_08820 [Firmicutes bacterium]|jgi:hypothetical protein|nr:hypothetical protein [Candidatus Fermentithermobacillaceae bacterium]
METKELLARFKKFQVGVFIILGVLLITNLVTLGWTLSRLNRLDDRLPISVSCSGSSYYTPPPDGVLASSISADMELAAQGEAGVIASFHIANKVPGATVLLAYRSHDDQEWRRTQMTSKADDPLVFSASVPVDLSHPDFEYRLEQVMDGEVVHASRNQKGSVLYLLGGNGDISLDYMVLPDTKQGRIEVSGRYGTPKIEAFRIAEVTLKINKATPQEITLTPNSESGYLFYTFDPAGLEDIEVTVVYADGEVRTTLFNPFGPRPEDGVYIRR